MTPQQIILAATSLSGLSDALDVPADEVAETLELSGLIEPDERAAIVNQIANL